MKLNEAIQRLDNPRNVICAETIGRQAVVEFKKLQNVDYLRLKKLLKSPFDRIVATYKHTIAIVYDLPKERK